MSWRLLRQNVQLRIRASFSPCFATSPSIRARVAPRILFGRLGHIQGCSRSTSTVPDSGPSSSMVQQSHNVAVSLKACPGCGALAQIVEPGEAGFYSTKRRAVRSYIKSQSVEEEESPRNAEDEVVAKALENVNPELLRSLNLHEPTQGEDQPKELPLCDRCHELVHHHTGVPIAHPSIDSIQDTIAESPYKRNHIYHVLDAADFPLSLIPNIHRSIGAAFQRSRNRRSKQAEYRHGKKTEISFIITRSDLLAPKKEQVDRLMQYFVTVLRDALGSMGEDVRLGNVRCVSAKRGWWTRDLKADIWKRGAGGWMLGKVNVGKSNLFEVVFPKGRAEDINFEALRSGSRMTTSVPVGDEQSNGRAAESPTEKIFSEEGNILLPPAREEALYPTMPTISSLPGTTASPIRIPFGNGRGELVDLPGLARSQLDTFVRPEHKESLVMKARITPEQHVLKPGTSLLLGGLIRITPVDPDIVILAYPFIPIKAHLTSTDKAVRMETEGKPELSGIPFIVKDDVGGLMASAGVYPLKWDVTKQRTGPLTSRSGVALKTSRLPFMVLSADILVEGVGWVELVAQVRKKQASDEPAQMPEVEVFSPNGKYVGVRQPMNAWLLGGHGTKPSVRDRKQRPRRSMASPQRRPV